jgi:predicted dehydrogenase
VPAPLSLGVIGCGHVMANAYSPLIEDLRGRGLVGSLSVCDVREDSARRAAERFGGKHTTDYRDVIADDDVDVVVVLTSMAEHGPITTEALAAGKHVLVEKPMSVSLEEAAHLVDLARSSRGHLLCAPSVILSPTYQAMSRALQSGAIGRPALARARYGWAGPDWGKWFYGESGGPLFDLGVYSITSLTGLLGPVRGVQAMAGTVTPERLVEGELIKVNTHDNYQITLDFGDDTYAVVTTGFSMQKYRSPAFEIYGSDGTMQMLGDDWAPDGWELWQNDVGAWKTFDNASRQWPWTAGLTHLIDCVLTDTPPAITPEHSFHVLDVMVKAIEAADSHRYVEVSSSFTLPLFPDGSEDRPAHLVHDRTHV